MPGGVVRVAQQQHLRRSARQLRLERVVVERPARGRRRRPMRRHAGTRRAAAVVHAVRNGGYDGCAARPRRRPAGCQCAARSGCPAARRSAPACRPRRWPSRTAGAHRVDERVTWPASRPCSAPVGVPEVAAVDDRRATRRRPPAAAAKSMSATHAASASGVSVPLDARLGAAASRARADRSRTVGCLSLDDVTPTGSGRDPLVDAADAFFHVGVGHREAEPGVAGRAERLAGHERHLGLAEDGVGQLAACCRDRAVGAERAAEQTREVRVAVERTLRLDGRRRRGCR